MEPPTRDPTNNRDDGPSYPSFTFTFIVYIRGYIKFVYVCLLFFLFVCLFVCLQVTELVYVHSKCMVVDDKYTIIGSGMCVCVSLVPRFIEYLVCIWNAVRI